MFPGVLQWPKSLDNKRISDIKYNVVFHAGAETQPGTKNRKTEEKHAACH